MLTEMDTRDELAYGCCFCMTGKEKQAAGAIMEACPEVNACAVRQIKRRSQMGVKSLYEDIVFPGYVFFSARELFDMRALLRCDEVLRLLKSERYDWELYGRDRTFAEWAMRRDGLIELSKAWREGERIRIASGPLKVFEGNISRIDKRNRSGQVRFDFNGREIKVWLGFDIIESLQ